MFSFLPFLICKCYAKLAKILFLETMLLGTLKNSGEIVLQFKGYTFQYWIFVKIHDLFQTENTAIAAFRNVVNNVSVNMTKVISNRF